MRAAAQSYARGLEALNEDTVDSLKTALSTTWLEDTDFDYLGSDGVFLSG